VAEQPGSFPFERVDEQGLRALLASLLPARRWLMLVDGRSGSGKSTFAATAAALLDAQVVATDDVAWHLHPIDWSAELRAGVLEPWLRGEQVSYRPPGWVARGRPGAVTAAADRPLVVEGVGAGRADLAGLADLLVWVHSDDDVAHRRGIARDLALRPTVQEAEQFWSEWQRAERPFLDAQRAWDRAQVVVDGTAPGTDGGLVAVYVRSGSGGQP
jgi:hypothetical protein